MNGFTNRTAKGPSEDSFVRGFGLQSLGRTEVGELAEPLCAQECGPCKAPCLSAWKLACRVPAGDDGSKSSSCPEPQAG